MTYISPEELDHIQTLRLINNIQKNTNKILNLINNNDISTTTLTSSINTGQHFTKERINQYYNDEIYNEEIKDEFNTSLPLLSSSSSSSTIIDNNNNNIEENYNQIKQNNIYLLNKYETNTLNNELNNNDSNNSILNNTITDLNNITNIIENNIFNIISQYNTIIKLSQEYKDAYLILINRNNIDNNLKNLLINTYQIYENSIIILKKIYVNRLKLKEELEKKLEDEKNELELLSSINIKSIEKAQFSDGILHENERIREENINKSLSTSSSFSSSSSLPFSPNSSSSPYPESPQVLYPPTTILASPLPPPSGSNFGSSSSSSSSTTAAATPYTSHLIEESTVDINETVSSSNFQSLLQDQKNTYLQELEKENITKTNLLFELSELTGQLKDTSIAINTSIVDQNIDLKIVEEYAKENEQSIVSQRKALSNQTKTLTRSLWTNILILFWVILGFLFAYIIIRLGPSKTLLN